MLSSGLPWPRLTGQSLSIILHSPNPNSSQANPTVFWLLSQSQVIYLKGGFSNNFPLGLPFSFFSSFFFSFSSSFLSFFFAQATTGRFRSISKELISELQLHDLPFSHQEQNHGTRIRIKKTTSKRGSHLSVSGRSDGSP